MGSSLAILSHGEYTQSLLGAPLGESANSYKLFQLIQGHLPVVLKDIYQLCGSDIEWFYSLSHLNMALHEEGSEPLISMEQKPFQHLKEAFQEAVKDCSQLLLLTWSQTVAGMLGLDFFQKRETAAKFYLFHYEEKIPLSLYEPFDLLVTESPLALKKAHDLGLPSNRLLYLPHQYPLEVEQMANNRSFYRSQLLQQWGRGVGEELPLLGMFCRFQYRKNVEYALNVLDRLHQEGYRFNFYLKGAFDGSLEGEEKHYTRWLQEQISAFQKRPWLLWNSEPTPFPKILEEYAAVDVALQLSGAESGSNTIVEQMALGVPVLVLNCSTNPSLFGEGVEYIKTDFLAPGALPFYTPNEEDLYEKVKEMLIHPERRASLSERALRISRERFHPERLLKRVPLLTDMGSLKAQEEREYIFFEDMSGYDNES